MAMLYAKSMIFPKILRSSFSLVGPLLENLEKRDVC